MTIEEFSNGFDTLINAYKHKPEFGDDASLADVSFDEYQKSIFLTQAQDIIVKTYFDKQLNSQGQGFDDSTMRQVDFSSLIKVKHYTNKDSDGNYKSNVLVHTDDCYDDRGLKVNLAVDDTNDSKTKILFMLNERLEVGSGASKKRYVVIPINYKEYDRQMSKAYAQPLKKQAWRLFSNAGTGYDIDSEIIPIYGVTQKEVTIVTPTTHYVKYVQKGEGDDVTYEWQQLLQPAQDNTITGELDSEEQLPENPTVGDLYKINSSTTTTSVVTDDLAYVVRYVRRPQPIILVDLSGDNLSIDGISKETPCELNPIIHMDILNEAVRLGLNTASAETQDMRQARQQQQRSNQ